MTAGATCRLAIGKLRFHLPANTNSKASAPGDAIAREAGQKTLLIIFPLQGIFAFPRRPQITPEAFSKMGEAYYDAKTIKPKNSVKPI